MSKKIVINTGGGDAPGLNAVIRSVVLASLQRGWECYGIRDGYRGILNPEAYPQGGVIPLVRDSVRGITHLGGTILGTTNKGNPLEYPVRRADGSWGVEDRSQEIVDYFAEHGFDALIAIGGDGSLAIASALSEKGLNVVGVPKTIDNDLDQTVVTFGFDSAVAFATECIDRLHSTAEAHQRLMVVEVMGRYAGWIALHAGVASTADVILIPEIPYKLEKVVEKIEQRRKYGRGFSIIVVAEGCRTESGERLIQGKAVGQAEQLGGIGHQVGAALQAVTGQETRVVVLGHLVRGGTPTARDRLLSLRFGAAAVRAIEQGLDDVMVALHPPYVEYVPISEVAGRMKTVPLDSDTIQTARDLGISLGD